MLAKFSLSEIPTCPAKDVNKDETRSRTEKLVARIGELQCALFAEKKQALLIVLQGVDGSGKDSTVKNVFSSCSHVGVRVQEFKRPTEEESAHDFLWRVHKVAPRKGMIQIFVRSHYEAVLIERVHKMISEERAQMRIQAINAFEQLLQFDNNTAILKFYLHMSREKQRKELQERVDDPAKQWKYNPQDWKEAKLWKKYIGFYEDAINQSSIAWHVVPADKHWYRDYVVADAVCNALEKMNPKLPTLKERAKK
jgi:PPK2 family polyphosphate:nucleotide phosphotransferase